MIFFSSKVFLEVVLIAIMYWIHLREVFFSSGELKAQVSLSDHYTVHVWLSVSWNICIFKFFSESLMPILDKLRTKYFWVKEIKIYSNGEQHHSPKDDYNENTSMTYKKFCLQNPISIKICTKDPWLNEKQNLKKYCRSDSTFWDFASHSTRNLLCKFWWKLGSEDKNFHFKSLIIDVKSKIVKK